MKLTKEIVKVKDCSYNRIEAKMDRNKESSCCRKSGELDNMTGTFMLKPIKSGFLDHIKSVIETKIENNNMWFENQFEGSMVKIKESVNKSIVVTHRVDGNKEEKVGKSKRIGRNSKMYQINQGIGYLPMNQLFTQIFDPGGDFRFASH
ncbi:hypothetical protein C2G38_2174774 [Gigaspora rosea]|uniref:Uncharacterized protein n=1 Tax=Gigaspora rosea TaxID=44941 RepID=A0A397VI19_9GLOM|nr:hypothetical protein C2G38_2174774 [Gigaspora rosea]